MLPQSPSQHSALIPCNSKCSPRTGSISITRELVANAESQTPLPTHWIRFCILTIFPSVSPAQGNPRSAALGSFYQSKLSHGMKSLCPLYSRALSLVLFFPSAYLTSHENTGGRLIWSANSKDPRAVAETLECKIRIQAHWEGGVKDWL